MMNRIRNTVTDKLQRQKQVVTQHEYEYYIAAAQYSGRLVLDGMTVALYYGAPTVPQSNSACCSRARAVKELSLIHI